MIGFYFAFLGVLLAGLGARDQALVAALSARQGGRPALLVVGLAVSCATAAFAAWAGSTITPLLAPEARLLLAALALGLAGAESLVLVPGRKPDEPTASLGAFLIVLLTHQLTDAARFLVFAVAIATSAPLAAGIGGAAGGALILGMGWLAPELCRNSRWRLARRCVGLLLLLAAAVLAARVLVSL